MKVLHLSFALIPRQSPASWLARIDYFVRLLETMALHVEVHSVYAIGASDTLTHNGVTHHFVPAGRFAHWFPWRQVQVLRDLQPDAVIVHGLHFGWQLNFLLPFLPRQAVLVLQHHGEPVPARWRRAFIKLAGSRVSAWCFTARALAAPWIQAWIIRRPQRVHEIMEVPSTFEKHPATTARLNGTYLWVGRLDANKDPLTLVRAFRRFAAEHPGVQLNMIHATNDLLAEVQSAIDGDAAIRLIGAVDHTDMLTWFDQSTYIISTSHREGSGIAVAEAMSRGCIPILTRIPSFEYMAAGHVGFMFDPGQPDSLLGSLKLAHSADTENLRQQVLQQYHENLSSAAISDRFMKLFHQPAS